MNCTGFLYLKMILKLLTILKKGNIIEKSKLNMRH